MKKIVFFLVLFISIQSSLKALDASITYSTFSSPQGPYIELYINILGQSVEQKMTPDSLFQSNNEVTLIFRQGDKITKFDKFLLNGPLTKKIVDIYDVKRYTLPNGTYDLEVTISDKNAESNDRNYKASLVVDYDTEDLIQSDITLMGSIKQDESESAFVKNGYYLEALPFNFYHKKLSTLIFYTEIYNTDKAINDDFLVRYYIDLVKGNGDTKTQMIFNKKRKPEAVNVLLHQVDITKLPSGNYRLIVEIRNREGTLMSEKSIDFQRSNPYLDMENAKNAPLDDEFVSNLDKDELVYSLRAIAPLVKDADVNVLNLILADAENLDAQRRFLFTFWAIESPVDTEKTYNDFMKVARWVDEYYKSGFGYGFETDRGHIFMEYGKPNDIRTVENDPSAPPFEIWVYERFPKTNQNRVKFLFYNPSLSPGNYVLLHSTARGELSNPQWELELYRDAPMELEGSNFIDGTSMMDNVGRHARRIFDDM